MYPTEFIDFTRKPLADALKAVQAGGYASAHPELNDAEKAVVYHYTHQGSDEIKVPIRSRAGLNQEPLGQALATAVAKLPVFAGLVYSAELWDETALRRLQLQAAMGPGPFDLNVTRWPTFLSASRLKRVAMEHLTSYGGPKNCLLYILSKTGRYIDALSHHGANGRDPAASEREVLLLPNTHFRVVAVRPATTWVEIELLET